MKKAGPGAVPQESPVALSASNGIVENGVKLQKGMLRMHLTALEGKLGVTVPAMRKQASSGY